MAGKTLCYLAIVLMRESKGTWNPSPVQNQLKIQSKIKITSNLSKTWSNLPVDFIFVLT